jgi:hypothetical protein
MFAMELAGFCPTAPVSDTSVTATGSLTFNADASYAFVLAKDSTFEFDLPPPCLNGTSCDAINAAIQGMEYSDPVADVRTAAVRHRTARCPST